MPQETTPHFPDEYDSFEETKREAGEFFDAEQQLFDYNPSQRGSQHLGMSRHPRKSPAGYDVFTLEREPAMEFLKTATDEKWVTIPKLK